jgi:hypothetical protein
MISTYDVWFMGFVFIFLLLVGLVNVSRIPVWGS